jgi:ribosomal protein L37AE/L43A
MTKLQNIKAIRQMLDGTHRTQTKNTVAFSDKAKDLTKREVGEVWTDESGVEWEQRAGFKIKKGKLDEIRSLIAASRTPSHCPKCNQAMTKRLDAKFWKLEGHCFDCQVELEHNLRIEGKYEEYERQRILKNAEAWLKDAEQEAKELAEVFRNPLTFANSDGTIEKWSGGMTGEELAEKIEKEFELFKENFINKLKNEPKTINESQTSD